MDIAFLRFPTDMLKVEIHKKLFGPNSQGNEITKNFIVILHSSKSKRILDWEVISDNIKSEDINEEYIDRTENRFYCSAYNCLCSLIRKTQTKEVNFVNFLFQTFRDKKYKDFLLENKLLSHCYTN